MEEEDLSVRTSRREMEGPSSPLTPVFAFGLGKREGGRETRRQGRGHSPEGQRLASLCSEKQRSGWAPGLAWGEGGVAIVPGVCA